MVRCWVLAWLVACAAAQSYYLLRERTQEACGLGYYGTRTGTPHPLVVTHMTPGVADWNIAVPMPPACSDAHVTGVDITVCDSDVPPDVTMKDMVSARVHRTGQLHGYATVNVTVYCVLPVTAPPDAFYSLHPGGDTRSLDDLPSAERASAEDDAATSTAALSAEVTPHVVKPVSSAVIPMKNVLTTHPPQPPQLPPTTTTTPSPPPPPTVPPATTTETRPAPAMPINKQHDKHPFKLTIKILPHARSKKRKSKAGGEEGESGHNVTMSSRLTTGLGAGGAGGAGVAGGAGQYSAEWALREYLPHPYVLRPHNPFLLASLLRPGMLNPLAPRMRFMLPRRPRFL